VHADTRQQPAADKGTDYPDKEVANDTEASASDNFASQPTRHDAYD
jgi:hypothetical protein